MSTIEKSIDINAPAQKVYTSGPSLKNFHDLW
jgi:hypothetical protein